MTGSWKQTFKTILIVLSMMGLTFCKDAQRKNDGNKTDLMKYGVPYSIAAPQDVEITKIGQGDLTDVSVKNKSGFDLQIFMAPAQSADIAKLKQNKKVVFTSNPSFSKIVEEYEDGYLFEKNNPDGSKSYDFIVVKVVGANEINFQCGNSKDFSEKEVKTIVASLQN